jgi:hypothetical protein
MKAKLSRSQRRFRTSYRHIKIRKGESRHHRQPQSRKGSNAPDNISVVLQTQHNAWHTLFSNLSPETICALMNEKWLPTNYRFTCERLM